MSVEPPFEPEAVALREALRRAARTPSTLAELAAAVGVPTREARPVVERLVLTRQLRAEGDTLSRPKLRECPVCDFRLDPVLYVDMGLDRHPSCEGQRPARRTRASAQRKPRAPTTPTPHDDTPKPPQTRSARHSGKPNVDQQPTLA